MKLYGITGWKNSGKTGLVVRLVQHFSDLGLRVSTVKHAHHAFDIDHPGRDSFRHREAGAGEVVIASRARVAVMTELRGADEPSLEVLLERLAPADLVLIEGYKCAPHPKIESFRAEAGHQLRAGDDPTIRGVASDVEHDGLALPVFSLDDTEAIAGFIADELDL